MKINMGFYSLRSLLLWNMSPGYLKAWKKKLWIQNNMYKVIKIAYNNSVFEWVFMKLLSLSRSISIIDQSENFSIGF